MCHHIQIKTLDDKHDRKIRNKIAKAYLFLTEENKFNIYGAAKAQPPLPIEPFRAVRVCSERFYR